MKEKTITEQITSKAIKLLEEHPKGLRTSELKARIEAGENFHPKTVNGIVWKLPEKLPDKVYKPIRGLFRLVKYKD